MYEHELEERLMNIRDSVYGVVTGQNREGGLYIAMLIPDEESGEVRAVPAFGYWSGRVNRGTAVLCTIKSWAKEEKRILVRIDSVDYGKEMAA